MPYEGPKTVSRLANRCGFTGRRWTSQRRGHFNWCRGVRERVAEEEISNRQGALGRPTLRVENESSFTVKVSAFANRAYCRGGQCGQAMVARGRAVNLANVLVQGTNRVTIEAISRRRD